jgi:hypothetical protein
MVRGRAGLSCRWIFFFFFFFLDEFILNRSSKLSTKPVEPYERTLHRYTRYGLPNARQGKHNKSEKGDTCVRNSDSKRLGRAHGRIIRTTSRKEKTCEKKGLRNVLTASQGKGFRQRDHPGSKGTTGGVRGLKAARDRVRKSRKDLAPCRCAKKYDGVWRDQSNA